MPTAPAACAGVVAVIVVLVTTVTPVAAVPPIVTVAPETKLVPLMVTAVPPAVAPDDGAMPVTVGWGPRNVNPAASVPLWPSVLATVTPAWPTACAGLVAVMVVALTTVTPVAAVPPIVTVAPAAKFVPVIVTPVPPTAGPDAGATLETAGGGPRYVNAFARVALWLSAFVTVTLTEPDACAGAVAVIVVPLTTVTPVAAVPPTVTVAPAAKPVPEIVRSVPPAAAPEAGDTPLTVGAGAM